jgi:ABC-type multidrug transport system ATPase subunit
MATLLVKNLHKSFGRTEALRGVTFEGHSGEVLALIGPNGAGKTTILRCVAGLLLPDDGESQILSGAANPGDPRDAIAFMPETPDLYASLTVAEHIRFIALAYRVPDWQSRAASLLGRFELTGQSDALPSELSQGMRRKLALTMALLHGAQVVLLDEPFNGLDPRAARELRELIRDLAADGVAVILSTHRLEETERLADRFAVTFKGQIIARGSLADLQQAAHLGQTADLETVFLALTEASGD